jgi:DASS family divalent anion:Na+ symporter
LLPSAVAVAITAQATRPGNSEGAIADALNGFANPLIWLIAIAMMISVALTKTGLGTRIGYYFISLLGKKTIGVAYGLVLSELVIALVTPSNTARGGAIIHPIVRSIADVFGSSPELGTSKKIGRYLALVNDNTNPITSAMFITATAPIIFGSGYTTLNEWWAAGAVMSVVNLLILAVVGGVWWKVLGYH